MNRPTIGRVVRFVGPKEEIAVAIITNVFADNHVNVAIIRDGVNQAHLPEYAYKVPYAPVDPAGGVETTSWHWPAL